MANLSMKTMIAALLAGSIAATAGGVAFANASTVRQMSTVLTSSSQNKPPE